MAEILSNLTIRVSGADEASAALEKSAKGLQNIGAQSDAIKQKFQEKFQHIGLMTFAGDALRASGVGNETRMVVNTLSLAMSSLSEVFGLASGPILLIVTAFTAVAGILEKVNDKHKQAAEAVQKLVEQNHNQLTSTQGVIESIDEYKSAAGNVPAYLETWRQSEINLEKAQVARQIALDQSALRTDIEIMQAAQKVTAELSQKISDQTTLLKNLRAEQADQGVVNAQIAQLTKLKKEYDDNKMSVLDYKAKIDGLRASIDLLSSFGTDDIKKLTQAQVEAQKEAAQAAEQQKRLMQQEADEETARYQHWAELRAKQLKLQGEMYNQFERNAKAAFNSINNAQAQAFANAIVKGQSFAQATAHIWQDLAVQVIAQVEAMIIKLLALYAVEQMTGLGAAAAMGSPAGKILGFAEGGSVIVDQPTMFLAGEGGQPEIASFTPLSRLGTTDMGSLGSGSSSVNVGTIETNVYGVTDPDQIASQVGQKIVEQIRGMGQINFSRSN